MNEHLTSTSLSSIFVDGGGSTADFLLLIMLKFQPYIKYQLIVMYFSVSFIKCFPISDVLNLWKNLN